MMPRRIACFVKDRSGVTSIEYALIAVIVAVGIVASVTVLGGSVSDIYNTVAAAMP